MGPRARPAGLRQDGAADYERSTGRPFVAFRTGVAPAQTWDSCADAQRYTRCYRQDASLRNDGGEHLGRVKRRLLKRLAQRPAFERAGIIALLIVGLFLLLDLGIELALKSGWTILWPLNGLSVALLLSAARKRWPVIALGVMVGTGLGELHFYQASLVFWERLFSISGVLLTACLLPRFTRLDRWLETPWLMARVLAGLGLGAGLSGVGYATYLHLLGNSQSWPAAFDEWSGSYALGIAVTLPLVLTMDSAEMRSIFRPRDLWKTLPALLLPVLVAVIVFGVSRYPLLFLLYPALLWTETRIRLPGSSLSLALCCLVATELTTHGYGLFASWPADATIGHTLALQLVLAFHAVALLPFSAQAIQRSRIAAELNLANARLETLAGSDPLTGLANRRVFEAGIGAEWGRAMRGRYSVALLIVDVDFFKQFNDAYGHLAGDACLQAVALALKPFARRRDDIAARIGGEEFAILLPNSTDLPLRQTAEQVRRAIVDLGLVHKAGADGGLTVSIGAAACVPAAGDGPLSLVGWADQALYAAKGAGRNCVALWEPDVAEFADVGSSLASA